MTTPLTPPQFGDKFSVAPTDIGSGYAAGITSAGQSIAGAISAVMGGINAKTGEAQEGILGQKKSSEDYLGMLHQHGMMTDDEYSKAMSSGLGAQQKIAGQFTADWNAKLQAELSRQNALSQIAEQNRGAMARTQYSESATTGRTTATIEAENQRLREQLQQKSAGNPYVRNNPDGSTKVPPAENYKLYP